MSTYAMCQHPTCPLRQDCTRHTEAGILKPSDHQTYIMPTIRFVGGGDHGESQVHCDYYWPREDA